VNCAPHSNAGPSLWLQISAGDSTYQSRFQNKSLGFSTKWIFISYTFRNNWQKRCIKKIQAGEFMGIRQIKIILVAVIALLCLVYAGQNVANLEAAYQSFAYVLGNVDHTVYASSFIPSITNPALIWIALVIVVGSEFLAGLLAASGAITMWSARNASAEEFNQAKKFALLGSALGVVIWLGFFGVGGGAAFQMWQTAIGAASLEGAFQFSTSCAIVFIIVSLPDA
jgi:predicted small integral membrane protein